MSRYGATLGTLGISHDASQATAEIETAMVEVGPTLEGNLKYEEPGDQKGVGAVTWNGDRLLMEDLLALQGNRTAVLFLRYGRGHGAPCRMGLARVVSVEDKNEVGSSRDGTEFTLAFDTDSFPLTRGLALGNWRSPPGLLAPADGPVHELDALAAGQSRWFALVSPHKPAPSIANATVVIRAATDAAMTAPVDLVTFDALTNEAEVDLVQVVGPTAYTHYQVSVTSVVGGGFFPIVAAVTV